MATIIKNNGDEMWALKDVSPGVKVPADGQEDLETHLSRMQIMYSTQLMEDVANPALMLVVNDGAKDLTIPEALKYIFGLGPDLVHLDAPSEDDGKPVFVNSPSTEGLYTWLTTRGDDKNPTPPASGRGAGEKLYLAFEGPGEKEIDLDLMEPWELHDGSVYWRGDWGFHDEWYLSVRIPASTVAANAGGTGDCNMVEIPGTGGTMHIIVPAAGDGAYDLTDAVPVPAGKEEDSFWSLDRTTEELSPLAVPEKSQWNLYDFQAEMYFCAPMNCGNPVGAWELDAYKAEWLSSKWKLVFKVKKVTHGAGDIGGHIMVFRPGATL